MCDRIFSLFGLVLADVLIINMNVINLGNHAASNLPALRDILKANLELKFSDQITVKKLLFIIRDFDPDEYDE